MSALTTRDALREGLSAHFVEWVQVNEPKRLPTGHWRCQCGVKLNSSNAAIDHQRDALLASGLFIDAATLADDEALVERVAWFGGIVADSRRYLRALATALTERGQA